MNNTVFYFYEISPANSICEKDFGGETKLWTEDKRHAPVFSAGAV